MYGIYIHIPFCVSKCRYCDFASYPDKLSLQDSYIDALIKEFEVHRGVVADTVYIGGGTPSVLSYENIKRLLEAINNNFVLAPDTEFTVEVNPATVDTKKAELLFDMGVNRISMGAQSFVDSELKALGRIHTASDIKETYRILRECGFKNISLDLMYALPGQTMESLSQSLLHIVALKPEHISCYGLKFEEGTKLYDDLLNGRVAEADEEMFADMYDYIVNTLRENGYDRYEISNFCTNGKESRHNLKYWQDCDYLGFGVAASAKEANRRYTHTNDIQSYIESHELTEDYTMSVREQMSEFIILALRVINKGVDKAKFKQKFGLDVDDVFADALCRTKSHIINTPTSIKLRDEAVLVSNSVMCEFMLTSE